ETARDIRRTRLAARGEQIRDQLHIVLEQRVGLGPACLAEAPRLGRLVRQAGGFLSEGCRLVTRVRVRSTRQQRQPSHPRFCPEPTMARQPLPIKASGVLRTPAEARGPRRSATIATYSETT